MSCNGSILHYSSRLAHPSLLKIKVIRNFIKQGLITIGEKMKVLECSELKNGIFPIQRLLTLNFQVCEKRRCYKTNSG